MALSTRRAYILENFPCEPDGCGARAGQPCRSYKPVSGRATGISARDTIHQARRDAYYREFGDEDPPRPVSTRAADYVVVAGISHHSGQHGPGRIGFHGWDL